MNVPLFGGNAGSPWLRGALFGTPPAGPAASRCRSGPIKSPAPAQGRGSPAGYLRGQGGNAPFRHRLRDATSPYKGGIATTCRTKDSLVRGAQIVEKVKICRRRRTISGLRAGPPTRRCGGSARLLPLLQRVEFLDTLGSPVRGAGTEGD